MTLGSFKEGEKNIAYKPLLICATTGSGKDYCLEQYQNNISQISKNTISLARRVFSRNKRPNEKHNIDGFFYSKEEIEEMNEKEEFIFLYEDYGNLYGALQKTFDCELQNQHLWTITGEATTTECVYNQIKNRYKNTEVLIVIRELDEIIKGLSKRLSFSQDETDQRIDFAKKNHDNIMEYAETDAVYKHILDNRKNAEDITKQIQQILYS
jgi:guanylate kinase